MAASRRTSRRSRPSPTRGRCCRHTTRRRPRRRRGPTPCPPAAQAAGFALPAVDTEVITITYPDAWTLFHHLRASGDSNATWKRTPSDRAALLAAAAAYQEVYGNEEGHIPASFQVIYLCGWAPHESQQRPDARGSGTVSLRDLGESLGLGVERGPPEDPHSAVRSGDAPDPPRG